MLDTFGVNDFEIEIREKQIYRKSQTENVSDK